MNNQSDNLTVITGAIFGAVGVFVALMARETGYVWSLIWASYWSLFFAIIVKLVLCVIYKQASIRKLGAYAQAVGTTGTLIGLALCISNIATSLAGDTSSVKTQLASFSVAFLTSLLGMAIALLSSVLGDTMKDLK